MVNLDTLKSPETVIENAVELDDPGVFLDQLDGRQESRSLQPVLI